MGTRSLLSPKIQLKVSGTYRNELTDGTVVSISQPNINFAQTLTDGVAANMANRCWQTSGTILAGEQATFDLYAMTGVDIGAGAGNDALGQSVLQECIVAIIIQNDNGVADAGDLEILPAASKGWTPIGSHTVATGGSLKGNGFLAKVQTAEGGLNVVDGTSHRITLRAVSGDVDYTIAILARDRDYESSSSSSSESSISSVSSSSSSLSSSVSSSSSSSQSASVSSISTSSSSESSISTSSVSSSSSSESSASSESHSSSSSSSESSSSVS
jgi:hypothetical protein